jgi:glyoxylase-like metal-dependent hydrolase (beta-lactamase superfamily II)
MAVKKVDDSLYLIDLKLPRARFRNFISTWAYKDKNLSFLVDPGPASTINFLKEKLESIGIGKDNLNYILLTHVHIDHAGGTGKLLSYFPRAQVVCHPRGMKHLIDPQTLWNASKEVLGDIADLYGEISPVPEDKILFQEKIGSQEIEAIETQGHASHHLSYLFKKYLFIGDAAGVHFPIKNNFYIRPATPPIFNYDIALASLDKLLSLNLVDVKICYAHYGIRNNAEKMLKIAREQLKLWKEVIENALIHRKQLNFEDHVIKDLMKKDDYLANVNLFDEEIKKREKKFISNSIKGLSGYIQKKLRSLKEI